MALNKNVVVTSATTVTQKRSMADWIRRMNVAVAPTCAMIRTSDVSKKTGDPNYGKGLIDKESTDQMMFEWLTSLPPTISYEAVSLGTSCDDGEHTGTAVLSSNANFAVRDVVANLTTGEMGIVNTLTSTTTLTVTAVGGTWTCAAGDTILMCSNAQEEGSSTYVSRTSEPTNNSNYVGIYRYAVEVAETTESSPQYGEALRERYTKDRLYFAMMNMENYLWNSKQATSTTTTVEIGGVSYVMYSTKGIRAFAQGNIDLSGTVDWYRLQTEAANQIPDTVHPDEELVMFCGTKKYNWIQAQASKNFQWQDSGEKDIYGVRIKRFQMGSYNVKIQKHDLFNKGTLANEVYLVPPSDLSLVYKKNHDLKIVPNIQPSSAMSKADEIQGTMGLKSWSGGANLIRIRNWVSE
jgi:hypothetical protein